MSRDASMVAVSDEAPVAVGLVKPKHDRVTSDATNLIQVDTLIRWTVEGSRTVFPIFNFGGVQGNTYFQLGFNDLHLNGRGQQLTAFYQNNNGEHDYFISLNNPSWRGTRWGCRLESRRYAAIEPVFYRSGRLLSLR